jgi:c-di-GMP-binding flagellar brake protein YcgR
MTQADATNDGPRASVLRSREDIARELLALAASGEKTVSFLEGGALLFQSRIAHVDPASIYILLEPSPGEDANKALLAQQRCTFSATQGGWRVEFVAASPKLEQGAIRVEFPEVLTRWQREHERKPVSPGIPLQCVADSEGIMPFEGLVVDIGAGGLGFLIHSDGITLEPGTILKSCLIEMPGRPPCKADLEVCYSQSLVLGDGTQSLRSGCRFVDTEAVRELIRYYAASLGPDDAAGQEPAKDLI